jgi:pimeloyl-ACP methyl ester carboxylesterase
MRSLCLFAAVLVLACSPVAAQISPVTAAISTDPPANAAFPAAMETMQIPSHGSLLNALLYQAAGAGPHATVVLLHGFPGNEKNLDLAQAVRRDGFNVLYFDYRGSWGTPGAFSFAHCMEDTEAALAYLRDPVNARRLRVDPVAIVLMGHSMGGMIALYTAAHDAKILAVGVFSAADMAGAAQPPAVASAETRARTQAELAKALASEGMAPLAGCTPEGLAAELMSHPEWALARDAEGLQAKPTLIITSDDGGAEPAAKLAERITAGGNQELKYVHIPADHAYSGKRIALEEEMLAGLEYLKTR